MKDRPLLSVGERLIVLGKHLRHAVQLYKVFGVDFLCSHLDQPEAISTGRVFAERPSAPLVLRFKTHWFNSGAILTGANSELVKVSLVAHLKWSQFSSGSHSHSNALG